MLVFERHDALAFWPSVTSKLDPGHLDRFVSTTPDNNKKIFNKLFPQPLPSQWVVALITPDCVSTPAAVSVFLSLSLSLSSFCSRRLPVDVFVRSV